MKSDIARLNPIRSWARNRIAGRRMKQMNDNTLAVFENYKIRRHYDEQNETWYFSVVNILQVLIKRRIIRRHEIIGKS